MNLLRVLLRSVCGSHPSDVPPKSKISVQIEQNGNGRRSGAFLHISFKNSSICKAFGVRQRPPQGAEFVCVPCGANNSKSVGSDTVRVQVPPPAPKHFIRSAFFFWKFFSIVVEKSSARKNLPNWLSAIQPTLDRSNAEKKTQPLSALSALQTDLALRFRGFLRFFRPKTRKRKTFPSCVMS